MRATFVLLILNAYASSAFSIQSHDSFDLDSAKAEQRTIRVCVADDVRWRVGEDRLMKAISRVSQMSEKRVGIKYEVMEIVPYDGDFYASLFDQAIHLVRICPPWFEQVWVFSNYVVDSVIRRPDGTVFSMTVGEHHPEYGLIIIYGFGNYFREPDVFGVFAPTIPINHEIGHLFGLEHPIDRPVPIVFGVSPRLIAERTAVLVVNAINRLSFMYPFRRESFGMWMQRDIEGILKNKNMQWLPGPEIKKAIKQESNKAIKKQYTL